MQVGVLVCIQLFDTISPSVIRGLKDYGSLTECYVKLTESIPLLGIFRLARAKTPGRCIGRSTRLPYLPNEVNLCNNTVENHYAMRRRCFCPIQRDISLRGLYAKYTLHFYKPSSLDKNDCASCTDDIH